jgi:hypothetical protein
MKACSTCHQVRPSRDFDLGGGRLRAACLDCVSDRTLVQDRLSWGARAAKIVALEARRRSLIAALVKIDAEIAELQNRPSRPPIALEDAEIDVAPTFGEDDDDAEQALTFDELS